MAPVESGTYGGRKCASWEEFSERSRLSLKLINRALRQDTISLADVDEICTRLNLAFPVGFDRVALRRAA